MSTKAKKGDGAPPPPPLPGEVGGTPISASQYTASMAVSEMGKLFKDDFGHPQVFSLDDDSKISAIPYWVPIGVSVITNRIGMEGIPAGRCIEVYGEHDSGKTTFMSRIIATAQRQIGALASIIDSERAYDKVYAAAQGVDIGALIMADAVTVEDVFRRAKDIILSVRTGVLYKDGEKVVVKGVEKRIPAFTGPFVMGVDSIGQTPTDLQLKKGIGERDVSDAARVISVEMRRFMPLITNYDVCLIWNNHTYKTQVKTPTGSVTVEKSYGGEAIKYNSALRFYMKKRSHIMKGDTELGMRIKCIIERNKVSPFSGRVDLDILRGKGIYETGIYVDQLIKAKILEYSSKGWFKMPFEGAEVSIQGKDQLADWFDEHPAELDRYINEMKGAGISFSAPEPDEDDGVVVEGAEA